MQITYITTKKKDIITQLKEGEKGQSLATKYGVDKATISRIRKDASKILEASEEQQDQKRVKPQKYPQIDEMMLEWFEEARDRNYVINDEIIKQTALVFGSDLGLTDFKASSSWVLGFKKSMESNAILFMVKLHQLVKQWWMITKHNLRDN